MPLKQNGDVEILIFKNPFGENCITLADLIKWLKAQQKHTPENELLHVLIRDTIKLNNENK